MMSVVIMRELIYACHKIEISQSVDNKTNAAVYVSLVKYHLRNWDALSMAVRKGIIWPMTTIKRGNQK